MSKNDDDAPLSAKAVAHACGITQRRLNQLVSEGTVTRSEAGFTLAAVRQYVAHV